MSVVGARISGSYVSDLRYHFVIINFQKTPLEVASRYPNCYTEVVREREVIVMSDFVEVGFSSEVRKALADFVAGKQLEAEGKAKKAQAEVVLREALGEAKVAKIGGAVAFKLVNGSNRHADLKALAENFPEAYEAVVRVAEYDFVRAV